ncbi:homeobox protein 5-like [Mya arenaria]|uniref:homeobox protein 5-like n=1 Tax=Mya arenaria TaxID=6604 RepID=UPI0022DF8D77|nr:homeobox protein 5-like [Mya arenaria]XP_052808587.1 homeobox protein 5-like [Mya arenaria]XP_052808588.1 homeobox protein 5-like [Mya arenaria]
MSRRMITPFDESPDRDFLEKLGNELGIDSESTPHGAPSEPKKSKSKRRRNRTKSSAEDGEKYGDRGLRNLSESDRGVVDAIAERQLEAELTSQDKSLIEQLDVVEPLKEGTQKVKVNRTSPPGRHEDTRACVDTIIKNSGGNNSKSSDTTCTESSGNSNNLGISKYNNNTNHNRINNSNSSSSNNNSSSYSVEGGISTSRSLRDIILEEEARSNKKLSKQSTNSEMKAKFSWRDVKKQQQNRQKGQGQEEVTHEGQRSSNEGGQPLQKFCPWGSSTQEVHSFRSVIEQDKATSGSQHKDALAISVKTPKPAVKGSPVSSSPASLSWGLQRSNRNQVTTGSPTLKINPTKGVTSPQAWSSAGPTSPESPEKPWSGEIIQSPTSPICSFYDIVKDEQLKVDTLTRASNKPLALIQIEEQAIQDLLIHYKAADSVEERITVERVVTTAATPLWKRERLQSSCS